MPRRTGLILGAILCLSMILLVPRVLGSPDNLVPNPGFEEGSGGTVSDWTLIGNAAWVGDVVHEGQRAVMVRASGNTVRVRSAPFPVTPHSLVTVSAWIRAQDVDASGPYHMLRFGVRLLTADGETRVDQWDLLMTEGSFDWQHVEGAVIVPEQAAYMTVDAVLFETWGTFWIDTVSAVVTATVPEVNREEAPDPVLLPQPWQARISGSVWPLGTLRLPLPSEDGRLRAALERFCRAEDLTCTTYREGPAACPETIIHAIGPADTDYVRLLSERFPDVSPSDLGAEGYYLVTEGDTCQTHVHMGANTEQGRFHAFQTFRQLLTQHRDGLYDADIVDRPLLPDRGIIMGVQWFWEQEEALARMAQLRLNTIWNQGSFMSDKFWFRWRVPLTTAEKEHLADYLALARQHFVEPRITIAPRSESRWDAIEYSSEEEVMLIVDKLAVLAELGFRHVGLSFDDLSNHDQHVLRGADIDYFEGDVGRAHAHLVRRVYEELSAIHPQMTLSVVPMKYAGLSYSSDVEQGYLRAMGTLPADIRLYTAIESQADADAARQLTDRPHLVWDNYWADYYGSAPAPTYVLPLQRPPFSADDITGYTFLPLIPTVEDAAQITWRTAADYAWAPERYDPESAFQRAAALHLRQVERDPSLRGGDVFLPIIKNWRLPMILR